MLNPRGSRFEVMLGESAGRLGPFFALFLALAAAVIPSRAEACAGCSNPNLPSTPSPLEGHQRRGAFTATVLLSGTSVRIRHGEACPEIGPICDARDEPPQIHDQHLLVGELRPILDYAFTEILAVEAQAPFRYTRARIVFRRLDGTAFSPDYENIHHRNETLAGIADPWLSAKLSLQSSPTLRLGARLGTTVPLGRIEEDPFALAQEGRAHQHVQFGTGTFNPIAAVEAQLGLGALQLGTYAQAVLSLTQNRHGYRSGHRFSGGLSLQPDFGWPLRIGATADLLNEQPERWGGRIQQEGNVGRTDLLAGLALAYPLGRASVSLQVKVPVWQHFIEAPGPHGHDEPGQLTYPAIVSLGVTHAFGGAD